MGERIVLLFTKPAVPGRVKTRLIGTLSAPDAARFHAALVEDLLARLNGGRFELRIAWALENGDRTPATEHPSVRQIGHDLGERLYNGLLAASREAEMVAAIGGDHPALSGRDVERAFEVLATTEADVVVGPTVDGGYYMLATHRDALCAELFESIPWSTPGVLSATLRRTRELGLKARLLPSASDVDTPEDLERLGIALQRGRVESPKAAALLRSWGRLPGEGGQ